MRKPIAQLQELVNTLLDNDSSWLQKRTSLREIHDLFVKLGAMNCRDESLELPVHLQLPSGRAIAPMQAGLCLFEIKRTKVFLEALRDAIADQLQQFPGKTIRVLDAGCGPYALFPLLVSLFYSPGQVEFTLLDIHPYNIESARALIKKLDLSKYFTDLIITDATTYRCPPNALPDIVLSETMNAGLQKEPQVAITLNLAPQMEPHGVLLPQSVSVAVTHINLSARNKIKLAIEAVPSGNESYETELATVLQLDRHSTHSTITKKPLCTVMVPATYNTNTEKLEYRTEISVYKQHHLRQFECSLTLPINLEPAGRKSIEAGDILAFYYELTATPGIAFSKLK